MISLSLAYFNQSGLVGILHFRVPITRLSTRTYFVVQRKLESNSMSRYIDQLAVVFKVTVPTEMLMVFEGEFQQLFVFVYPLCTLVIHVLFVISIFFF